MRREQEGRRATQTRVDWPQILRDLGRKGYATESIAQVLGIPKATLMGWKNLGVEPKYADGEALLIFWASVTTDQVPRTNCPRWLETAN